MYIITTDKMYSSVSLENALFFALTPRGKLSKLLYSFSLRSEATVYVSKEGTGRITHNHLTLCRVFPISSLCWDSTYNPTGNL